ncbi:S8 family peptidase [Blautia schinkii]|uniref:S8 family peptidase n=1 Tax=Blautia schinkii TaxID=180164 RepID=UPI001570FE69|nr:S8 family peptidase [Blautia schinkii]NSG81863.1 S8 family peptidase [Blautia schinkii]NSK22464.1 S8 family peptidase [Blautia schinkii]NSK25506.1 S8 family peptidase [Blautia schinkii]NSK31651.1 S8 family peptidase [Blautia schinkii]NSK48793.1 S8 family peptidase [Blautia schinkii]
MFGREDFEFDMETEENEIPGVQPENPAQSEHFGDFIVKYMQNVENTMELFPGTTFQAINEIFGILYVPLENTGELEITGTSYNSIPKCYTYMDMEAAGASGITRLHDHPYLKLRGKGTAVAVIDSGIDYQNEVFRNAGGSRIAYLWDQSLEEESDMGAAKVPYGRLFRKRDIDLALDSENPFSIVPSRDTNGHGTALAGIAAGNMVQGENFTGAAPEATLIIIKVKPAKQYLRNFYLYPPEAEVFQEDDVMMAIAFAIRLAKELGVPLSICVGIGSSQGAHLGTNALSQYVDYVANFSQVSVSVAAGNEGNTRNHSTGIFSQEREKIVTELRVAEREQGFTMEFWGEPPEIYELSIQSPTGEILEVSSSIGSRTQELSFVFVETKVYVNYILIERQTGYSLVYIRFFHPASGIWKIFTQGKNKQNVQFHMWLPVEGLISQDTYFLEPSPYTTVTAPGDARNSITATAYQHRDGSIYIAAGRGYTPNGMVTPHLAAPGVNVKVPLVRGGFGIRSGTSISAAQTAGIAALLFEWAIIRNNQPFFTGSSVKYYLQRGARREENMQYPNPEWGYGRVDLYHTFELLT